MKVKVLNRDPKDYLKTRVGDLPKLPKNADPTLHPHAAQREYTAALNAVKLERVFAKPFIGSLDGKWWILVPFSWDCLVIKSMLILSSVCCMWEYGKAEIPNVLNFFHLIQKFLTVHSS